MQIIHTPAYRAAFVQYLRRGTPLHVSLKAAEQRPTTHYIWRTSGDSKVRSTHAENDGKIFAWDSPPETGHPGEDYNCRCWAEPYYGWGEQERPYDQRIESVYPEALIVPLLRIPRFVAAWRLWLRAREESQNWQLSPTKSATKWRNQIEKGNWTPEKITRTIRYGQRFKTRNERTGGNATRYELEEAYIVRDDITGDILQVSRPGHLPKLIK